MIEQTVDLYEFFKVNNKRMTIGTFRLPEQIAGEFTRFKLRLSKDEGIFSKGI